MNYSKTLLTTFFLSWIFLSHGQVITSELEVQERNDIVLRNEGVDKVIVDKDGLSIKGSLSLNPTRHGKVYVASNHVQKTHAFDLLQLFPKLDFDRNNLVMVKVSAIARRRGVDESVAFDMVLLRDTHGAWFSSAQDIAKRTQYSSGWAYGTHSTIYISGHGEYYTVAGTIEVIIESP